jgi:hypothetical protein
MKAADGPKSVSQAPFDCKVAFCTNPGGTSATPVAPVDEDLDGRLLAEATADHRKGGLDTFQLVRAVPYRDSKVAGMSIPLAEERSVYSVLDGIKSSGIPAYHYGGWFDGFSRDTPLLFRNWPNSKKLIMGPWYHAGFTKEILETEYLRWFDYWLKGIDNGIMDEDAVHYYVMGASDGEAWRTSKTWPLPNEQRTPFYFSAGKSGSIDSVNDGVLDRNNPVGEGMDKYEVDYSTALSVDNRHTLASGGRRIKLALYLDASSVHFMTAEELDRCKRFLLLEEYLGGKEGELAEYNRELVGATVVERDTDVNMRRLTNIGTFRAYAYRYLGQHPQIRQNMPLMVRHLSPGPQGIPIEVYCFTSTTAWSEYENIQADIFDHLLAIVPEFELRLFQQPAGTEFSIRQA